MRDESRIDRIFQLLNEIWKKDSDLRFMQMIYNLQREYSIKNNGYGLISGTCNLEVGFVGFDMFNLEDNKFERFLIDKLNE